VNAQPLNQSRPVERREPAFQAPERADPADVDAVLFGSDWRNAVEAEDSSERRVPVLGARASESARRETLETPMSAETGAGASGDAAERSKVAEVAVPEPIVADEPKRPRRLSSRKSGERAANKRSRAVSEEPREAPAASVPVEELIVMNVLAENDRPFTGDELFAALRTCGLKFGDMNIFHRVEPLTKSVQYSVANAVEPGTFDMADMEAMRCPGLCFFMQLPGPEDPSAAFEDMFSVAKSVVKGLGGDVRDEHRNIMTPQTVEHYRARIVDFSRRRMSKRA
jgi:cell division protein ZipA